jgi:hypothetical protein
MEVLEGVTRKPGRVLLVGSISHLQLHGVSINAVHWITCVMHAPGKEMGMDSGVTSHTHPV